MVQVDPTAIAACSPPLEPSVVPGGGSQPTILDFSAVISTLQQRFIALREQVERAEIALDTTRAELRRLRCEVRTGKTPDQLFAEFDNERTG